MPALGVSCAVVFPAISSGAKEPQLKQHSNMWDVVFLRCWSKMWFSSLLTVPLRLCTMQPCRTGGSTTWSKEMSSSKYNRRLGELVDGGWSARDACVFSILGGQVGRC